MAGPARGLIPERCPMSIRVAAQAGVSAVTDQPADARVIKPLQFDERTPQTTGMRRLAAISHDLVGAEQLWAGVMLAEPGTASTVHHHGPLKTVVFILAGRSRVRW